MARIGWDGKNDISNAAVAMGYMVCRSGPGPQNISCSDEMMTEPFVIDGISPSCA